MHADVDRIPRRSNCRPLITGGLVAMAISSFVTTGWGAAETSVLRHVLRRNGSQATLR